MSTVDARAWKSRHQSRMTTKSCFAKEVGVGTDRELVLFHQAILRANLFMVLGHEATGHVIEVGAAVTSLRPETVSYR
jgi:hypothetical protein